MDDSSTNHGHHDTHDDNNNHHHHNNSNALRIQTENLTLSTPRRIPSTRSISSINGSSYTSSPILTPSGSTLHIPSSALTPLPSPLVTAGQFPSNLSLDTLVLGSSPRRKGYGALGMTTTSVERRNVTEFVPDAATAVGVGPRSVSSGLSARTMTDEGLRREEVRGPRSRTSSVADEILDLDFWRTQNDEWIHAPVRYVKLKSLGRGTFSKVILAEPFESSSLNDDNTPPLPPFLAIKVVSLGAIDDAPADRITSSAKRELEILKRVSHPSITRLLAYKEGPEKCLFALPFSPGGDLFDFASKNRTLLIPTLVKRIFKELALAVQYLHTQLHVVHRDLKLENILLNYTSTDLSCPEKCPTPLIALTDLGLSRPFDLLSPFLTTRCGSTDYAAPEIILGQPYDGRTTDSWALGVILYCLLESRLPFDPPPDARRLGKVAHRIAMGQWKWYRLARERRTTTTGIGAAGAGDVTVGEGGRVVSGVGGVGEEGAFLRGGGVWEGGMEIVEGLLRRKGEMRWGVGDVLKASWLSDA